MLQLMQLLKNVLHLFKKLGMALIQILPYRLLKGHVLSLIHGTAFDERDQDGTGLCHFQKETFLLGFFPDFLQDLLLLRLAFLDHLLVAVLILVAGEGAGYIFLKPVEQVGNFIAKLLASTLRHADSLGPVEVREVMDVSPVLGMEVLSDFVFCYEAVNVGLDHGCFAGSGQSRNKDIIAAMFHGQAELYGPNGPVLADKLLQWGQVLCAIKIKNGRVALPTQHSNRNFQLFYVHRMLTLF